MKKSAQNKKIVKISLPSYIAGNCFFEADVRFIEAGPGAEVHDLTGVGALRLANLRRCLKTAASGRLCNASKCLRTP